MSAFRRRTPRTVAARRALADGLSPSARGRGYLPTERDDLYTRLERCWKQYRKTRYKTVTIV